MSPAGRGKRTAASKPTGTSRKEGGAWEAVFAPRNAGEKRYWLVKSEPSTFSFDDLLSARNKTTNWDGVRNFTARNFMRDGMKLGDRVLFYHSSVNPQAIVGVAEVVREAYPEPNDPDWCTVDLKAVERLPKPVTLPEIKQTPELAGMALLRIGRLSVTPVSPHEWDVIQRMAKG
jgi:predicted RNA-binding protein with PUA-like domain